MCYSIVDVAKIIKADPSSVVFDQSITILLTDSRSLSVAQESLFFALKTQRNDGHHYVQWLYQRGVRAFVVSDRTIDVASMHGASFLFVKDTLWALQRLAAHHRKSFTMPVIGITGSNGKTIVKEWLYQLLHHENKIARSPRSFNSQIGVPLSVWRLNDESQLGIFEAGISLPNEMDNLSNIIRPNIGILTHIGVAHQEGFGSMQQKCFEKLKLFKGSDLLIYNADNKLISQSISESPLALHEIAWSKEDKEKPLYIVKIEKNSDATTIRYSYIGLLGEFTIPFADDASVENAIHCLAVMLYFGYTSNLIAERMLKLEPVAMRMEVKDGINNCTIVNDSYTLDIQSLDVALDFLSRRATEQQRKKTIIMSDIMQSGMLSKTLYRQVNALLRSYGVDRLIGIGKEISAQSKLFELEKEFYPSAESFLKADRLDSFQNELILLKGSRQFHLEDISEYIERKVHETIMEVNLDALVHNFNYYKSKLAPTTKIVCMVKAFGYGAGSTEIGKTLQEHGCDYLAVATADEGMELRKAGVYIPIMVMNPEFGSLHTLFNHALEPEIYSFKLLDNLIHAANRHGISQFPVHIKINTGMNRLGFHVDDVPMLVERLQRQSALSVSSVFSHLMASDNSTMDETTRRQIEIFTAASDQLRCVSTRPIACHILNTAGIVRFTDSQQDMVRLGIGLYGIPTVGEVGLRNVSTLKTNILQLQTVAEGDAVGYGGLNCVKGDSLVAIIPIGYADGLDRRLSNGVGEVLVRGCKAPIVGSICMDISMVDVTHVPGVTEGDEVIVFGDEMPVKRLADSLQTIAYEILTSVSVRVKRIYIKE